MKIFVVVAIVVATFGLVCPEKAQAELWGAVLVTDVDQYYMPNSNLTTNQCRPVGSITWNYRTKRGAVAAAREECRKAWVKLGLGVPLRDVDCGDLQNDIPDAPGEISGQGVLGVLFGPGQCGALAFGRNTHPRATCPTVAGWGLGNSKSEAERKAIHECRTAPARAGSCRIKLSGCNG